ncbi:MAG: NYN domain-containing protein [Verrucomicrobiota bacterium]
MKTFVYVDAFNLYYGSVKGTPYKWLDINTLCRVLLSQHSIERIKYFTALVDPRPDDPSQPMRQRVYLRALRTIPNLEIVYGHYLTHVVPMPVANPQPNQPSYVRVIRTDEKGSDVNLACHLLRDAHLGLFECAVIMSGDSDLKTPVVMVRNELKLPVGVINPQQRPCRALKDTAAFYKHIRTAALQAAQFSPVLTDSMGTFSKPASW